MYLTSAMTMTVQDIIISFTYQLDCFPWHYSHQNDYKCISLELYFDPQINS